MSWAEEQNGRNYLERKKKEKKIYLISSEVSGAYNIKDIKSRGPKRGRGKDKDERTVRKERWKIGDKEENEGFRRGWELGINRLIVNKS